MVHLWWWEEAGLGRSCSPPQEQSEEERMKWEPFWSPTEKTLQIKCLKEGQLEETLRKEKKHDNH